MQYARRWWIFAKMVRFYTRIWFLQLVDFPTRDNNILDVFLTNYPSYEYTCQPLPCISDHEIALVKSLADIQPNKGTARRVSLCHKADFESIRTIAADAAENFLSGLDINTPIDTSWNCFKRICTTCLEHVPSKFVLTNHGSTLKLNNTPR